MSRTINGPKRNQRKKKLLKLAKGAIGRRSRCHTLAVESVNKKLNHAYVGRKLRKRSMKSIWIQRINAFARKDLNMNYSTFKNKLKNDEKFGILNNKILSQIIVSSPEIREEIKNIYINNILK